MLRRGTSTVLQHASRVQGWAAAAGEACQLGGAAGTASRPAPPATTLTLLLRHTGRRALSSSSAAGDDGGGGGGTGGPPPSKLTAIPFRVSRAAADAAYARHHTAHALLPRRPPRPDRVEPSFQPFWAVGVAGTAVLDGATLGFDRYERVYDPATRRWRAEVRTVWRKVVVPRRAWAVAFDPADPAMQVPASFRYPAADAGALRPGPALAGAGPVAAALRAPLPGGDGGGAGGAAAAGAAAGAGGPRPVDPFELPPAAAVSAALAHASEAEAARAGAALRAQYRADRVGAVDLALHPTAVVATPVLVPAWAFHWSHYGTPLATLVSGLDPAAVAGDRALDEVRVAGAVAAAAGVAMLAAGGPPAWMGAGVVAWGLGLALPAAAAALAAHWAPWAGARLAAAETGAARAAASRAGPAMDAEYVAGAAEAEARARAERARARARAEDGGGWAGSGGGGGGGPAGGPAGDPRGYYAALGVPRDASTRDIQAAYRGLALTTHPDRVPDAEKAAATKKFAAINAAYQVLRDPVKRREYDRSG